MKHKRTLVLTLILLSITLSESLYAQPTHEDMIIMNSGPGVEIVDTVKENGVELYDVTYRYFLGSGMSGDEDLSIKIAKHSASRTVTATMQYAVYHESQQVSLEDSSTVYQALSAHWTHIAESVLGVVEPFGSLNTTHYPDKEKYVTEAMVAMKDEDYKKLLQRHTEDSTKDLDAKEESLFLELNEKIIDYIIHSVLD